MAENSNISWTDHTVNFVIGCTKVDALEKARTRMSNRKNLLTDHPSHDVRAAAIRLLDALCMWERNTGRNNLVIIKDSVGCEYRSLSGSPLPPEVKDVEALEAFSNMEEGF